MKTINYSDIDFKRLDFYSPKGWSNNEFYLNERDFIYKIFKRKNVKEHQRREKVLDAFDSLKKDYVVTASSKIKDNDLLVGYESKFIDGDTLGNLIRKRGILVELKTILQVSKYLEDLHNSEGNPVIGDLHFSNIVVDDKSNPYFVDHDSFGINDIKSETVSSNIYNYCNAKNYQIEVSQDSDRLALLLLLFDKTFGRNFIEMRNFAYGDYYYQYPFLKDLKELYKDIINQHKELPKVPYLHYVIKE